MKVENLDIPEGIREGFLDSGITDLNPPQQDAVKSGLLDAEDMIIASPTASGKTLIAEIGISKQVVENNKTAIYIVPLKALASEKYQDFSERFEDQDVRIAVGDHDDSGESLSTADIVVATSEKLDSLLRHNPSWIHEIGLVVIDEIHLITSPDRGPTLEVTIARLRDILDFQLLGLSATISNSDELADWLDAELVESKYRPVELKHGVYWDNEIEFYSEETIEENSIPNKNPEPGGKLEGTKVGGFSTGNEVKEQEKEEIESEKVFIEDKHGRGSINLIQNTLNIDKQAIVFCSSRKGSEKSSDRAGKITTEDLSRDERKKLKDYADRIENVLGSPTSQCKRLAENVRKGAAFHHAGLVNKQRELVEDAFREGLVRTVSATPTLAAGVNLPAYRVIMRDLKRYTGDGMDFIPTLEYEQMCLPYGQEICLPDGRMKKIGKIVENKEKLEVLSYNTEDDRLESCEVTEHYQREEDTVLEIVTETGSFQLTENHPVLTYNNEWKNAKNLEEGDLLKTADSRICNRNPFFHQLFPEDCYVVGCGDLLKRYKSNSGLTDEEIAEELGISSSTIYHYKNDRKAIPLQGVLKACEKLGTEPQEISSKIDYMKSSYGNKIAVPERISEDFMWLIGLIITDGNLNKTTDQRAGSTYTSIRVFNTDENIIDKAKSVFSSLGLECYEEERDGTHRIEVGNTLLAQVLNESFKIPYGNKSQKTEISDLIYQLPEKLQAAFIEGVFDGDGSYYKNDEKNKLRIHFSTSSKKFSGDLQELLSSFDIKSRIDSQFIENIEIKGKEYEVNKNSYSLKIRSKHSVNRLSSLINPVKAEIESESYSNYHDSNEHRKEQSQHSRIISITEKSANKVYNIEVEDNHNYITGSRTVLHNCGRAGRPKYDDQGEAISIAKQPGMPDEIRERYIFGQSEHIQSKLAAEPVLRMHTLSLVASGFCTSMEGLLEFYSETLYAFQYGELSEVEQQVKRVVDQLRDFDFLEETGMEATKTGRRVSELYIDPESAYNMIQCMKRAEKRENTEALSYLFMACRTTEIRNLRVKNKEYQDIAQTLLDAKKYLLESAPNEWDPEYDSFLESLKTSLMLKAWINEKDEESIMDKYDTAPGGVRAKTRNADWLLYSAQELARMKEIDVQNDLKKLRVRLKHGIGEDLLSLVKYDQIGRVRARKLYDHGIRDREDIREVSFEKLKKLIGKRTAKKLKKQVGEENIFDRENIMDYF
ncbi:DEAD/DEAH box helicase [Candidatus Nanohalococcus occultus]|uniref:ATP-dependent DNA helicase Hel308 n=1 Tax=Candidatus Nanohalococcus occultus TaxID=2978047 RepID=A0ABY8CDB9_9ARCH|nr:Replicative superfamily II helicase [Candidatus Nanohaloarchaeota archaeon SVXNc]